MLMQLKLGEYREMVNELFPKEMERLGLESALPELKELVMNSKERDRLFRQLIHVEVSSSEKSIIELSQNSEYPLWVLKWDYLSFCQPDCFRFMIDEKVDRLFLLDATRVLSENKSSKIQDPSHFILESFWLVRCLTQEIHSQEMKQEFINDMCIKHSLTVDELEMTVDPFVSMFVRQDIERAAFEFFQMKKQVTFLIHHLTSFTQYNTEPFFMLYRNMLGSIHKRVDLRVIKMTVSKSTVSEFPPLPDDLEFKWIERGTIVNLHLEDTSILSAHPAIDAFDRFGLMTQDTFHIFPSTTLPEYASILKSCAEQAEWREEVFPSLMVLLAVHLPMPLINICVEYSLQVGSFSL